MAQTQLRGTQVLDGSVQRSDMDVSTAGEAVIRKIIAGTNITISSTGVDAGTGDVTINAAGGSGSPGGTTGQIQYNNAGVFAGAANVAISSTGNLNIISAATPTPPAANTLTIFNATFAGKLLPGYIGPSGVDSPLQASLYFTSISSWCANSTTTINSIGALATAAGAVSTPTLAATNFKTQLKRTTVTSTATAGNVASLRSPGVECWRGNAANLGGFFAVFRFALTTLQVGNRGFFGLVGGSAAPTNINPLTDITLAKLGVGFNLNTGNLSLINSSTTAVTATALGANFPINTTNVYQLCLFAAPNGSTIQYLVTNLNIGASSDVSGTFNANIPTATTFLNRNLWMTNNATAAAVAFDMVRTSIEIDV